MNRTAYYDGLRRLAHETRAQFGLETCAVQLSDMRRIYGDLGIRIDLWAPKLRNLRGAYFNDDLGASVLIAKSLPREPRIFTMCHELKHHLVDRDLAVVYCDRSNELEPIEIGAEVFAAEVMYPEALFVHDMGALGVARGKCVPGDLVGLKRTTKTTLSYAGLRKRAEWLGFASASALEGVQWKKLEEQMFGEPAYKRVQRLRKARA